MNLLQETIEDIAQAGKTPENIVFIGSEETGHRCTWDEFRVLADVEYNGGFGSQKVASDLIIVFDDGSKMWRHEYDGSENWDYSTPFKVPAQTKSVNRLVVKDDQVGWESLANVQSEV